MKTIKILLATALIASFFTSCQKEEASSTIDTNTAITSDSPLTNLLLRVSKGTTAARGTDDVSTTEQKCFTVQLPVKYAVDSSEVEIHDIAESGKIRKAIHDIAVDEHICKFIFPITLVFNDQTTLVVNNLAEFKAATKKCHEFDDDDAIDNVKINYPITIKTYDTATQTDKSIVLNNNAELLAFLRGLDKTKLMAIQFPITVKNSAGQTITIQNKKELQEAFEHAVKELVEKIKEDLSKDLIAKINVGTWAIKLPNNDAFNIVFNPNRKIVATSPNRTVDGTWELKVDGERSRFKINFIGDSPLTALNQTYVIKRVAPGVIILEGKGPSGNLIFLELKLVV